MTSMALNTLPTPMAGLTARALLLENLLDSCCSAVAVCDGEGEIHYSNRAARKLLNPGAAGRSLILNRGRNRQAFLNAVQVLSQSATQRPMLTLRIGEERVLVTLSSLGLPGEGLLRMVFHHPRAADLPDLQGLACHYALTPKETCVAERLACGRALAEIADELGRSVETVRCHLKSLFQKTATHSQTELVALINRNEWQLP